MNSKYQEALNYLCKEKCPYYDHCGLNKITCNQKETLQELIDNYSKLEKALDIACELNIKQRFDSDYPYIPIDVIEQKEQELKEILLKESEKE